MLRRLLGLVLRPIWLLLIRAVPEGDPWERVDSAPRLYLYGSGARLDFGRVLHGESRVTVTSLDDIQGWLLQCRYESDQVLFAEEDFWQHPVTFEHLRAGDCEDFALWAWRKMIELDFDADLVTGYCLTDGELAGRHAWVVFRRDGSEYVFEPADRDRARMVQPLATVRDRYLPQFGVDRRGRRFTFTGYLTAEKRRLAARSRRDGR
ncbi:MAG TPA: hypothetical protein VF041_06075 [Gemmatimonadaceae bacterium]